MCRKRGWGGGVPEELGSPFGPLPGHSHLEPHLAPFQDELSSPGKISQPQSHNFKNVVGTTFKRSGKFLVDLIFKTALLKQTQI